MSGDENDDTAQRALVDEALKKGALVWLELAADAGQGRPPQGRARWHAWVGGRIYLLTGGEEQPDPGLSGVETLRVVVRSKDTRHRMIAFEAEVSHVAAADPDWEQATTELARVRLNLPAPLDAPRRWQQPPYTVYRLTPRLPLLETPATGPGESGRRAPVPTPAVTTGRLPWVLHRRRRAARRLS